MQTTPRPPARKAPKFLEVKIMIAALSAAVTVGFWNLFAGQSLAAQAQDDLEPLALEEPGAAAPVEDEFAGLPPVPTLVPLMDLSNTAPAAANPAQAGQAQPLRSVAVPTVVVVQKNKPLIDAPAQVVVNSGGRSPARRPAATTRSSR